MSALVPAFSKFLISTGNTVEVYVCPANRSHAFVDLNFYKDANPGSSLIAVALTANADPAALTSVDFFVDDIELIDTTNIASLEKVMVGRNERLFVRTVSGSPVSVRTVSMEETNSKVGKAGRLAAVSVPSLTPVEIYSNTIPNTAYVAASLTIFNTTTNNNADVEGWITSATVPSANDKVFRFTIPAQDTTIIQNMLLAPNERIFIQSNRANTEYFLNGVVVLV